VAQRTGAERFLAPAARAAGAGLCLALAAAALLLAGCGGSSGDSGSAGAASSTAGTASAGSPDSPSSSQGASPTAEENKRAHPSGAPGGGGQKHAPLALPKDESGREHAPTAAEKANSPVADMTLFSPSLPAAEGIAALTPPYTCDGAGSWPALRWGGVPAGTKELALYVMSAKPVNGRLFFDWAVAGLGPHSEGLEAGRLPAGAVEGTNSFGKRGYSICPEPGGAETYLFALFALPRSLSPKPGFDPRALREEILATSGNAGLLSAAYARG